jgi:P-aminobenzoate N-oxygenase AurF
VRFTSAVNVYKVLPDLGKKRQLALWHKALRSQWSAEDVDWRAPQRLTLGRLKDQLARVLTPILMGEQAALYSVSSLIPILGHRSQVEGQFYLTTWAVDEARHTELFARFYGRLDRQPLSIRRFPSGYLFQSQIGSKEPGEWLAGVLVSEVAAKLFVGEFLRLDLDPVLSSISEGILKDEARHLAFNHVYLEDLFTELFRRGRSDGEAHGAELHARLDQVLALVPPVFDALDAELRELGIDREHLYQGIAGEARERLRSSIERGEKVADREAEESSLSAAASAGG